MSVKAQSCVPPPRGLACATVFNPLPGDAGALEPPRAGPHDHPRPEPRALEGCKHAAPPAKAGCASPPGARRLSHTFPGPANARARLPTTTPPGIRN